MPYSGASDKGLPSYVLKRDEATRKKWVEIFNSVFAQEGESKAFAIANTWLKKHVTKKKEYIKRSCESFSVSNCKRYIKRDDEGNEYISFVLSSVNKHLDGRQFSEETLKAWEQKINKQGIVGDIDHEFYNTILHSGMTDEGIDNLLKNKKGIAKTLRAIYSKGKLWVRAVVDKQFAPLLQKVKGASIEASREPGKDWDLTGFSFNINTTPADPSTGVYA